MHVRKTFMPRWWNGRHWRLKISWPETAVRVRVPLAVHGFRIANNLYYFFDTHKVYNTIRLMFKKIFLPFAAVALLALTSCSGKLGALSADNFNVNPNPMETQGGSVPVTINGNFPEKYMKKKAVVTVTPELRAADGSILRGTPATFQGEKVMGNNQTISYKLGGHYTMKADFPYTDTYHKSDLYLSFNAMVGKKVVEVPAVKVANGIIATSELYRMAMTQNGGCIALDTFQRVRQARQAANIKFLINQAQLRKGELNNTTVQDFLETLRTINNEKEAYILSNIEVKAYASPDGGEKFNDKLAAKRQNVSEKYVKEQLKKINAEANVTGQYTAQDWEGFQQLVAASNMQDKELILRVLSMYQDPEEREQQIKNMSAGFRQLADEILPELRRSRLIINYETVGRSDEQIQQQYAADAKQLSVDEILYAATLNGVDNNKATEIYKTAASIYPNDYRAFNNLAVQALKNNDVKAAQQYAEKALAINPKAAEAKANLALVALKAGNVNKAQEFISQAIDANDYKFALGTFNIAKGDYAAALDNLKGQKNNVAALAQLLNKDYAGALNTIKSIGNDGDGVTDYIRALISARQGNSYAANTYLKDAISKDASLATYAENDLEFNNVK